MIRNSLGERVKRYSCENVLNLDCDDSIGFGIFQAVCKSLLSKLLNLLSCALPFLYVMMFRRFKIH